MLILMLATKLWGSLPYKYTIHNISNTSVVYKTNIDGVSYILDNSSPVKLTAGEEGEIYFPDVLIRLSLPPPFFFFFGVQRHIYVPLT